MHSETAVSTIHQLLNWLLLARIYTRRSSRNDCEVESASSRRWMMNKVLCQIGGLPSKHHSFIYENNFVFFSLTQMAH
jgi:hypothetical protein